MQSDQFTANSDVCSFGMVMVELLTGKRSIELQDTEAKKGFAMAFACSSKEDILSEILEGPMERLLKKGS